MAAELGDIGLDSPEEIRYGSPFVIPEDFIIPWNILQSILSSTSPDLTYLYEPLGDPSDMRSSQEITPNPFPYHDLSVSSTFPPQITAPADGGARLYPIYSTSIPPLPPIPSPQIVTSYPRNWRKIPQEVYDHGRKSYRFRPSEPILFHVNGRAGVNMGDALRKKYTGLDGRDDPMLQDARSAISCRLLFPGYPRNSSCQIFTRRWNKQRDPISRSRLAYQVAKKLDHYLDSMANLNINGSTHQRWTIGEGFMRLDNMFLVQLENVGKGSYQPEIWVVDRTMTA